MPGGGRRGESDRGRTLDLAHQVRLIDPRFDEVADFFARLPSGSSRSGQIFFLSKQPRRTLAFVLLVSALPWIGLPVDRVVRDRDPFAARRSRGWSMAVAVLDLRADGRPYLAGGARQAVRTNNTRAVKVGTRTVELTSESERHEAFREILHAREPESVTGWPWLDRLTKSRNVRCFGAFSPDGTPLAVGSAECYVGWASVRWFLRHPERSEGGDARYLLHTAMVEALGGNGVDYLTSDSALRMSEGVRYLHHLLGYRPTNVQYGARSTRPGAGYRLLLGHR